MKKGMPKGEPGFVLTKQDKHNLDYVTKNFKRSELACPCCGKFNMDEPFLDFIQKIRTIANIPMPINSGVRCREHNLKVGGSQDSAHINGWAIDVKVISDVNRYILLNAAMKAEALGIGVYRTFIHIDKKFRKSGPIVWYG